MLYSSGTTGRPKGIVRPLPLAPMGESLDPLTAFLEWCGFGDGQRLPLARAALPRGAASHGRWPCSASAARSW